MTTTPHPDHEDIIATAMAFLRESQILTASFPMAWEIGTRLNGSGPWILIAGPVVYGKDGPWAYDVVNIG